MIKLASFFESAKRTSNGETFVTLKDNCPDWLQDAVHEAHAGDMPNDWIYATCRAVCEALDEVEDCQIEDWLANDAHEFVDGQVDIYTRDLYTWAADMFGMSVYANAQESADDGGDESQDEKRLAVLQYYAIDAITQTIAQAVIEAEGEEDDNLVSRTRSEESEAS